MLNFSVNARICIPNIIQWQINITQLNNSHDGTAYIIILLVLKFVRQRPLASTQWRELFKEGTMTLLFQISFLRICLIVPPIFHLSTQTLLPGQGMVGLWSESEGYGPLCDFIVLPMMAVNWLGLCFKQCIFSNDVFFYCVLVRSALFILLIIFLAFSDY